MLNLNKSRTTPGQMLRLAKLLFIVLLLPIFYQIWGVMVRYLIKYRLKWDFPKFIPDPEWNVIIALTMGAFIFLIAKRRGYACLAAPTLPKRFKHVALILVPILFMVPMNLYDIHKWFVTLLSEVEAKVIAYHFIDCMGTGFAEEFAFRVLPLVLLLPVLGSDKKGRFKSALIGSALFGVIHLANAVAGGQMNFTNAVIQSCYSFCIGMAFSGILLYTRCILLCGFCHGLVNFSGIMPVLAEHSRALTITGSSDLQVHVLAFFLMILPIILSIPLYFLGRYLILNAPPFPKPSEKESSTEPITTEE